MRTAIKQVLAVTHSANRQSGHMLETVARACVLLRLFSDTREALSLADVVKRTGFEKTIAFRMLRTLEAEGMLRCPEGRRYLSNVSIHRGERLKIGYASQSHDSFSKAVTEGVRCAAARHQIDLLEVENCYSAKTAVRNAEHFVRQKVNLAIEFQVYDRIGAQLAAIYEQAAIPVIAVEIPQPGATFFGVDNFAVGQVAGRALAKAAIKQWAGEVDELLLLELNIAGALPNLRITGAENAIRRSLTRSYPIVHLDTRGELERSLEVVRRHLQFAPRRKTLITGINDLAVLGALRAFEEVGRSEFCLGLGVGALPEARREMRRPHTRLAGSVATFPERYGEHLVLIALDLIRKQHLPPATYAPIQLVTPQNIDRYYPQSLFEAAERQSRI